MKSQVGSSLAEREMPGPPNSESGVPVSGAAPTADGPRQWLSHVAAAGEPSRSSLSHPVAERASGIAHDVNNLLFLVMSSIEKCSRHVPADGPARSCLDEALGSSERAAALVRQLLELDRGQERQSVPVNLNSLVDGMAPQLRGVLGDGIELALRMSPALRSVLVDPMEIERAILNIAFNARDAMPSGGTLWIETSNAISMSSDAAGAPTAHVVLAMSDTGHGMQAATLARAFEPFYTTRTDGRGLGLASVKATVHASGGSVHAESTVGRGTTIRIFLPVAPDAR